MEGGFQFEAIGYVPVHLETAVHKGLYKGPVFIASLQVGHGCYSSLLWLGEGLSPYSIKVHSIMSPLSSDAFQSSIAGATFVYLFL